LLALGAIGLMAGATPALAQDGGEATRLGGVTVTDTPIDDAYNRAEQESDKSTAPLLDTPQTVSVISREVIRDRAARTLSEVLRNTPGITFDAGENGFGTNSNNFSLRGFDTSGSVFTDNARDSGSYARDMFNVESVEVVKGAAADNGRGSAGGYVNINTKKPSLDGFIAGDIGFGFDEYDSKDRKRASLDINQPLGGTAAIRLNAVVEDSGVPGRAHARNKLWGVAPSIAVGLGTPLRAYLSWEHVERDDRPDWGVSAKTIESMMRYNPLSGEAPRDAFYGLLTDFDDANSDAVLGRIEFDVSDNLSLSNQPRWSRVERSARFTTPVQENPVRPFDDAPTQTLFYARTNEGVSNLTNLSARFDPGGIRHSLALGVELSWEDSASDRQGAAGGAFAPGVTDLFDPDPSRVGAAPFNPTQFADVDVDTIAFYLYDTIEIGEHFEITGGVRGESYKARISDSSGSPADNFSVSRFVWNGKVGLVYKPSENGSIYASFGTSALPPGSFLSNSDISRTGDGAFPGFVNAVVGYGLPEYIDLRLSVDNITDLKSAVAPNWTDWRAALGASRGALVGDAVRPRAARAEEAQDGRRSGGEPSSAKQRRCPRRGGICELADRRRQPGLHAGLLRHAVDHLQLPVRPHAGRRAAARGGFPSRPAGRCAAHHSERAVWRTAGLYDRQRADRL